MPVPQRVPIAREAGYRTDTIGRHREGQFYAAVHGGHRDDDHPLDCVRKRVHWYASLHLFDADGSHCTSEISLIGVAPYLRGDLGEQAAARLAPLLGQLKDAELWALLRASWSGSVSASRPQSRPGC
jgi:hypothetical protein